MALQITAAGLADQVLPHVAQELGTFGGNVAEQLRAEGAESAVSLGRRLLRRLWHRGEQARPHLERAVDRADRAPENGDARAALRLEIHELLATDEELRREIAALLPEPEGTDGGSRLVASGERSAVVRGDQNTVITGDGSRPRR